MKLLSKILLTAVALATFGWYWLSGALHPWGI